MSRRAVVGFRPPKRHGARMAEETALPRSVDLEERVDAFDGRVEAAGEDEVAGVGSGDGDADPGAVDGGVVVGEVEQAAAAEGGGVDAVSAEEGVDVDEDFGAPHQI